MEAVSRQPSAISEEPPTRRVHVLTPRPTPRLAEAIREEAAFQEISQNQLMLRYLAEGILRDRKLREPVPGLSGQPV